MEIKVNLENYEKEVLNSNEPVILDFYADWCGPCKMMMPILEDLDRELAGKVKIGKINVDENQDLAMQYNVMSIPTIVIMKAGQEKTRFVGVTDKNEIIAAL